MGNVFQIILNGLSQGGVYALIALGYTMVYGIAKMLNFAHGDLIMVGGYTVYVTFGLMGFPLIAIIFAVVFCTILGICVEKFAYKPLRGASPLAVLITAIGVSYLLQSLAFLIFKSNPRMIDLFPSLSTNQKTIITLVTALVVMAALTLFINFTRIGKAMRAVSEDKGASQLMGINSNMIISITFAIGSALAAIAGAFYLLKTPAVTYTMGSMPGIKAFTAAVIGGIGSIPGAMVGGLLLGLIEEICSSIPGLSSYTIAIEFGILIIILLVRPSGILGKKRREKV